MANRLLDLKSYRNFQGMGPYSRKIIFGLVKMTLGLLHANSHSLPKGQAAKLTFFVPL